MNDTDEAVQQYEQRLRDIDAWCLKWTTIAHACAFVALGLIFFFA